MRHHLFETSPTGRYSVALLMKANAFHKQELLNCYVNPLSSRGIAANDSIAFTLEYNNVGKAPAAHIKAYLDELMPELQKLGVQYLYVADSNFFKTLTKQIKADVHHGYVLPCKYPGYEHMKVVLGINYQQLIYNPDLKHKLEGGLFALASDMQGAYQAPGTGIIHSAQYPETLKSIQEALNALHQYPSLEIDIEAFSLRFNEAGIGTISFAWDKHHGIAFACDYLPNPGNEKDTEGFYGKQVVNAPVRKLLKEFLSSYKGTITFHRATYDVKVLIYSLWMKDLLDTRGLLEGLDIMCRDLDDTLLIAYLATNSTAGNILGLKHLAHEFAGNWAKDDIKDIRKIPLPELLQYNLVDALSTNYVKAKYWPIMVADNQLDLYQGMFQPSQKLILQIELTGMPMSKAKIKEVKDKLEALRDKYLAVINGSTLMPIFEDRATEEAWNKDYEERKAKAKNPGKIMPKNRASFPRAVFNPNSGPQLQVLLYELMGLPIIDLTETKLPATGGETIEKLINHTTNPEYKAVLEALIGYGGVIKVLNTFIPAFEAGIEKAHDGIIWLHGSFNLGGTVSGRLSSSDPNMQNIPAGSEFGKLIKEIFMAAFGWLFAGADFNSLEDYVSALTTKDPNKLAVYEKGFDGHSLRAAYYFKDQLIQEGIIINLEDPKSVNSLKKHPFRQESKAPTFALTYQGTYHTLMSNLGWSEDKAKMIEKGYHDLYVVSDQYVQKRLKQASVDGYVEVAFGLRLRTPLLKQCVFGASRMPFAAAAEGRTAGNAMGQSYGLLNNRAAVAFMRKVWASPYRYDILPVALIHDAIYLIFREDPEIAEWVNRELINEMKWQKLPELQHPTVKLGANLDIFWPAWHNPITLPNDATAAEIITICKEAKQEYLNPKPKKE